MAKIGSIGVFDESLEDFETYVSRVELYFIANDVKDVKKVPAFLTLAGPKVFGLAKSLLSPNNPADATFAKIVESLTNHYKPKTIVIYERFKFYSRNQKQGETIADFVAGIKSLAHTCNFGEQLSDMLRDRFVMGLLNESTQHTLLAESDLTFERSVEIATAREAAHRDVQAMGHHPINKIHNVNYSKKTGNSTNYSKSRSNVPTKVPTNSKVTGKNKPKSACSGCGQLHWRKDCPYKEAECFACHRKGHLKNMCFTQKKSGTQVNTLVSSNAQGEACYDYVFSVGETKVNPITMTILMDKVKLEMEVDTGAARSLISEKTYEQLWSNCMTRPKLRPSSVNLKVYGGSPLKVTGEIDVWVKLPDEQSSLRQAKVIVTKDHGPSLLGRDLLNLLELSEVKLSNINKVSADSPLLRDFPELFSPGLGCMKDRTYTIEVDPTVPPKYCKARTVPYALREKVDKELDRLVEEEIITPITSSPWAAPIVPVLKSDKSVRICGDYKLTVNKAAHVDTYPIPRLEDLFSKLSGGTIFSKLDMSQAYAQLVLDEKSKPYTVINTQRGLFAYNRLCFGISSAPGIFQRAVEQLLGDLPGVLCYLDDVLICASSPSEHDQRLRKVLSTLQSAGLKLRLDKCAIGVSQISYLGFLIDKDGIHPTIEKVQAILNAPKPTNVTQLRAYLGLLNFYRRFLPKAATILQALTKLLGANVPWSWGKEQEDSFRKSKQMLLDSNLLVHFDPNKPLVVVADSSAYGIGAVLCHVIDGIERPIYFASRTLATAERNYSQLEKEALAMVYALRKFHLYLWGQKNFTVVTDHKPLLGLFSPSKCIPPLASGRIQRWALLLQAYSFTLVHRSGCLLGTADALSRLPLSNPTDSTPVPADWTMLVNFLDWSPVTSADIREHTRTDQALSRVYRFCEQGWPTFSLGDPDFAPYVRRRDELSIQSGCVLWGTRVVVPSKLRSCMLRELHSTHTGSSRMKELARSYVWWPNLDKDLEELTKSCSECLALRPNPPKAELHPWEWPQSPWHRLHVDYAGPVDGRFFLILVDAHSKWVDVHVTRGTTALETIKCLRHSFSTFGLPVSLVSDNGPCFTSQEFKEFVTNCGIRHITTAVYKPSTNGLAEKMVQTFKKTLRTTSDPVQIAIDKFLFNYRMTPHTTTGVSPAELMFGRRLRSRLDLLWPSESIATRVAAKQQDQKDHHSVTARHLQFHPSETVAIRNYTPRGPKWIPAKVQSQTGPLSYRCALQEGGLVKRHQDQMIPRSTVIHKSPTKTSLPITPTVVNVTSPEKPNSPVTCTPVTVPAVASPPKAAAKSPAAVVRRSSRNRKPVDRLNL